jgi:glycosyltransferase involved in cell wall biosynthesis
MRSIPKVSVITPSFRSGEWLKLSIASVADQEIQHEHIIQDSCSDDGTQEWLSNDPRVKPFIEKDAGMYDAVNRGMRRATGDIVCYLNCDEQYLPGALGKVQNFLDSHPDIDVVFANVIVTNPDGTFLCHRKAILPGKYHAWVSENMAILTCATFFRRRLIDEYGLFFKPTLKDLGDVDWVMRLIDNRVHMAVLREFASTFTDTGRNMNIQPNALREKAELVASAPLWARVMKPVIIGHYRLRRLMNGAYFQKPFTYSIYTRDSPNERQIFEVKNPTFRWRR